MSGNDTILVVDDDPQSLHFLVDLLEAEGYRVEPADSGKLALVSVAAQPPDLILLDVRMPEMDGFEVCRRLKESQFSRRVPVMFVSGSREKEEWVEGLLLGAVDFVSKPFQREELLARVRTHLELAHLRSELETRVAQRTAELNNAIEQLRLEVVERRRMERALREGEQQLRQITNIAPVIIWTSGPEHRIDSRNEYAQAFTGRTMEELVGDRWAEVVHPEDLEIQRDGYLQGVQTRNIFQLEYRIRRADGEYRWMLDKGTPRFLPNGAFAGYVGVIFDFTDVKRSQEAALRQRNLENLRVLAAGIAHDFNTLLGAIFGEVDLSLGDMSPDAPGRESVVRIGAISKRAADIVRLLLAYVGGQSDGAPSELADLTSVVQEIVPHLKAPIPKGAEIRTDLARKLPTVRANLLQIRLVVLNLIMNAVEALQGEPGLVTVTTAKLELQRGSGVSGPDRASEKDWPPLPEGVYVRLAVSDTGQGMTDDQQDRIFDPYYTTKNLGRGMGLAAVMGIIRSHCGAIAARSSPGAGSTLEVLLPAASNTQAVGDTGESGIIIPSR